MSLGNAAGLYFTVHGTQATLDLETWEILPEGKRDPKSAASENSAGTKPMATWRIG